MPDSFNFNFKIIFFAMLPNFPAYKFVSTGNISSINKRELFLWSCTVISALLASTFLSVCIVKSYKIVAVSVSTAGRGLCFLVWYTVMLAYLPAYIFHNSITSDFLFSGLNYMASETFLPVSSRKLFFLHFTH